MEEQPYISTSNDFTNRLIYTLAIILVWRILLLVPAPGIIQQSAGEYYGFLAGSVGINIPLSILGLGLKPYISAYILVEILALLLRPLKTWRAGGIAGRLKLRRAAFVLTILIALIHGKGLATGFEVMTGPDGSSYVPNPGWSFQFMLVVTLTAGTFLTIWLADLISAKGIGHGISVMFVSNSIKR